MLLNAAAHLGLSDRKIDPPWAFRGATHEGIILPPRPERGVGYEKVTFYRNRAIDVSLARWAAGGASPLHGHGESSATYQVLSGRLQDERYLPDGYGGFKFERVIIAAGEQSVLPPGTFHRVTALEESLTLHSYSPVPEESVASVPPEIAVLLQRARQKAECTSAASPRSLPATIDELAEAWAVREAAANASGELQMPAATVAEMKSSGVLAAPLPLELGGWNANLTETARAIRQLARRAPATALALVMPLGNAATTRIPLSAVPSGQRSALRRGQQWIAEQVTQGQILAVANSEPGAGGDLRATKTAATLGDDGTFRLTGRKSFATFGRDADYFLCAARNGQGDEVAIDGFFVHRDAAGLVIDDKWNPVGMRPTASVGLSLEATPAEAILGYPGCLEGVNARYWSTVLFGAVFLGIGEGALAEGIKNCGGAGTWVRGAIAELALKLDAAAAMVQLAASDERYPLPRESQELAWRAKTFVAKTTVELTSQICMMCGGRSYSPNHPVFRFLCDALAGPLLRPPLPQAMDEIVKKCFGET